MDLTASLGPLNYPKAYPIPRIMAELNIKDPNHHLIKEPVRLTGAWLNGNFYPQKP